MEEADNVKDVEEVEEVKQVTEVAEVAEKAEEVKEAHDHRRKHTFTLGQAEACAVAWRQLEVEEQVLERAGERMCERADGGRVASGSGTWVGRTSWLPRGGSMAGARGKRGSGRSVQWAEAAVSSLRARMERRVGERK